MTEPNSLTKELAKILKDLRTRFDNFEPLFGSSDLKRIDAVLDQYEDACKQSEEPMTNHELTFNLEPEIIEDLWQTTPNYKVFARSIAKLAILGTEKAVSKQWAKALTDFVDRLGGDSPALWLWAGLTPTPEAIVAKLQELFDFHNQISADNELDECCRWLEGTGTAVWDYPVGLRNARRPQPTLKEQALKNLETIRNNNVIYNLPEILDTIEKALKSIPE